MTIHRFIIPRLLPAISGLQVTRTRRSSPARTNSASRKIRDKEIRESFVEVHSRARIRRMRRMRRTVYGSTAVSATGGAGGVAATGKNGHE